MVHLRREAPISVFAAREAESGPWDCDQHSFIGNTDLVAIVASSFHPLPEYQVEAVQRSRVIDSTASRMDRQSRSSTSYSRDCSPPAPREKVRTSREQKVDQQLLYLPPCSRCGKRRTPRTDMHTIHPLDQIICRRPECARFKHLVQGMAKPANLVIKVNHYHYDQATPKPALQDKIAELPRGSSVAGRIELPAELSNRQYSGAGRPRYLHTVLEGRPPQIDVSNKPTSTVAETVHELKQRRRKAAIN